MLSWLSCECGSAWKLSENPHAPENKDRAKKKQAIDIYSSIWKMGPNN
jgi:hypothetical protein